jgi:hypothetical protein
VLIKNLKISQNATISNGMISVDGNNYLKVFYSLLPFWMGTTGGTRVILSVVWIKIMKISQSATISLGMMSVYNK